MAEPEYEFKLGLPLNYGGIQSAKPFPLNQKVDIIFIAKIKPSCLLKCAGSGLLNTVVSIRNWLY